MNNYNEGVQSQSIESNIDSNGKNIADVTFRLKRFYDTIDRFSNFEIDEIKRIQEILNQSQIKVVDNHDCKDQCVNENIIDFLRYAFDDDTYFEYLQLKEDVYKINQSLNFELKSLIIQKKKAIENYDVARAIKIGDKIINVSLKIKKQRDKISDINNEINSTEKKFYNDYLSLLNDISSQVGTKKLTKIDFNKYDKNVYRYFLIQKLIFYIVTNELKNLDAVVYVLKTDNSLKNLLKDVVDDVLQELIYVGTNC